ncbi:unnamed protein product [Ilex paraguariensis]|uniref:Uncharacterized protein n=1 Tax=Ilex paraguariensis TaxID=185542 RepID=A0ABC8ULE5_9AQUA
MGIPRIMVVRDIPKTIRDRLPGISAHGRCNIFMQNRPTAANVVPLPFKFWAAMPNCLTLELWADHEWLPDRANSMRSFPLNIATPIGVSVKFLALNFGVYIGVLWLISILV